MENLKKEMVIATIEELLGEEKLKMVAKFLKDKLFDNNENDFKNKIVVVYSKDNKINLIITDSNNIKVDITDTGKLKQHDLTLVFDIAKEISQFNDDTEKTDKKEV